MSSEVTVVQGSREFLYADLRTDRVLDTQAVSMSVSPDRDANDWQNAEWVGDAGKTRSARILLDGTLPRGLYNVFARITDNPEAPILLVGKLKIF